MSKPPKGRTGDAGRAAPPAARRRSAAVTLAALVTPVTLGLAGCGGSSDTGEVPPPPASCSVRDQQGWLTSYMDEWYFWYRLAPRPGPAGFASVQGYFDARLYTGSDPTFPADRFSRIESTAAFDRFYGDGATLGYGLAVNGLEAVASPGTPLVVRYVEPLSPAAAQGVRRGDAIVSVNGRSAADLVAANDFAALTPAAEGQRLDLVVRGAAGGQRSLALAAAVFKLTPVAGGRVSTTPGGRRLGYVMVKDMIGQAEAPLDAAFAALRAAGVDDLVLDLRYNGGGLVSVGATVASLVAGARGAGQTYARLLYNDRRAGANNQRFVFTEPAHALGLARVFVLTGARTCSASEQVINALAGVGVQVVTIGDTSCGKPVGMLPRDGGCGVTYSVVNFESVNARNEGRYFDGFAAACAAGEDWAAPMGDAADPLYAGAVHFADTGQCAPTAADGRAAPLAAGARPGAARRALRRLDERSDMVPR